ncbi:hypothetical protein X741_23260 [Mesorhizobium sp. LNHC229A00]|nr:hypothetical protein X741_23260 [Mesorhizobium sp. LNHC229A00]
MIERPLAVSTHGMRIGLLFMAANPNRPGRLASHHPAI